MVALFVYGTLMRGQGAHDLLAPWVQAVTPGALVGELYQMPQGYPALLDRPSDTVHGQLLDLADDAPWARIDAYEGYDPADPARSLYDRVERLVELGAGKEPRTAWVYLMHADRAAWLEARAVRRLPTGRWDETPAK